MQEKSTPPPLPDDVRRRMTGVARANGLGVVVVAGLSLGAAMLAGYWDLVGWSALAVLAGGLELRGQHALRQGDPQGLVGLIGAQFLLLVVIWAYAWLRWRNFDPDTYWAQIPSYAQELLLQRMRSEGLDPELDRPLLLMLSNLLTCICLAAVSFVYQGGLAAYYAVKSRHLTPPAGDAPPGD